MSTSRRTHRNRQCDRDRRGDRYLMFRLRYPSERTRSAALSASPILVPSMSAIGMAQLCAPRRQARCDFLLLAHRDGAPDVGGFGFSRSSGSHRALAEPTRLTRCGNVEHSTSLAIPGLTQSMCSTIAPTFEPPWLGTRKALIVTAMGRGAASRQPVKRLSEELRQPVVASGSTQQGCASSRSVKARANESPQGGRR
jgi:hypothetical protein